MEGDLHNRDQKLNDRVLATAHHFADVLDNAVSAFAEIATLYLRVQLTKTVAEAGDEEPAKRLLKELEPEDDDAVD